MPKYIIGIDVGGTKTAYGLFLDGEIIRRHRHASDANLSPERFFNVIAENISILCDDASIYISDVAGIGIAVPSFVRASDGYIMKTANLPKLCDFGALDYLKNLFPDKKLAVCNDNHAAAVAEHAFGAGRGYDNMLYCLMSTGMASGIIINGRLFRGSEGTAGESGHTIVTPGEGPLCGCGNRGCISAYASATHISNTVKKWLADGEESIIAQLAGYVEDISPIHIFSAYEQGDTLAKRAIELLVKYSAVWLYNLYVTLNINCFVFGGGLLRNRVPLLSMVRERFDEFCGGGSSAEFMITQLGEDFGIMGAMKMVCEG